MEVWIETPANQRRLLEEGVTSHVEVWIETNRISMLFLTFSVTSHVEVWIETACADLLISLRMLSPPTWRCGLKL